MPGLVIDIDREIAELLETSREEIAPRFSREEKLQIACELHPEFYIGQKF